MSSEVDFDFLIWMAHTIKIQEALAEFQAALLSPEPDTIPSLSEAIRQQLAELLPKIDQPDPQRGLAAIDELLLEVARPPGFGHDAVLPDGQDIPVLLVSALCLVGGEYVRQLFPPGFVWAEAAQDGDWPILSHEMAEWTPISIAWQRVRWGRQVSLLADASEANDAIVSAIGYDPTQDGSEDMPALSWLWEPVPPGPGWRAAFEERAALLGLGGDILPDPLRVPTKTWEQWAAELPQLLALARRAVLQRPAQDDGSSSWALARAWAGRERVPPMMRGDAVLTAEGIRFCELNMSSSVGGLWSVSWLATWFGAGPRPVDGVKRIFAGVRRGEWTIGAMVPFGLSRSARIEARDITAMLNTVPGCTAVAVDPATLRVSGDRLADERREFDALYCLYSLTLGEGDEEDELRALRLAATTQTAVVSDPIDLSWDDKALLAELSEAAAACAPWLSAQDVALVERYVPWTRRLGPEWLDHAQAARARLVLKRTRSRRSQHIIGGEMCSEVAWMNHLTEALADPVPWLLQERLVPQPQPLTFQTGTELRPCVLSPFVLGDRLCGVMVRGGEADFDGIVIAARESIALSIAVPQ